MLIIHRLKDILLEIFPDLKKYSDDVLNNIDSIKDAFTDYYTYGPFRPIITIEDDLVTIDVDTESIDRFEVDFNKAVYLAEKGRAQEAKLLLKSLIEKNPSISEFHRNYGQLLEIEGKYEESRDAMIDALKWDPRNKYALLMMGNIYAKHFNDFETAKKFYNEVLSVDPDDYIALCSIGAVYVNFGKYDEAEQYFNLSKSINKDYPNNFYGLGMIYKFRKDFSKAFDYTMNAVKISDTKTDINRISGTLLTELSRLYADENKDKAVYSDFLRDISKKTGKEVRIEKAENIKTPAKVEEAGKYGRNYHLIKFINNDSYKSHFILHELIHLDLIAKARADNNNKNFKSDPDSKRLFLRDTELKLNKLLKSGLSKDDINNLADMQYHGLLSQIFNNPLDLIVEDFIYRNYPQHRPSQLHALLFMQDTAIETANKKEIGELFPKFVIECNIVMNLVHAYQIKELFGIDITDSYNDAISYKVQANKLYNNFKNKQNTLKPGDEYDLVSYWGNELKLTKYFKLVPEVLNQDTEDILKNILKDPLNIGTDSRPEQENRIKFDTGSTNSMAVVMYCLAALQLFDGKDKAYIKEVTFEIAMLGSYGLNPNDNTEKYSLKSLQDKKYTALQLLAYEYVGFQLFDPSLDIGLDFQKEYETAKGMYKKG
jgi:tetratricopeptide (TPR) repeat protein